MVSIIVPVYNVGAYLRKCLDSILNQTYRELEILVIDDGSTDRSGRICDEYRKDRRVRVFHTENRGLSCARNLGLDEAKGEWIGFVDADDWIEPDMYELLIEKAVETGADIVECGWFREYPKSTKIRKAETSCYSLSLKAIEALLQGRLSYSVWDKVWKKELFSHIRFPEGRVSEDIAVTYKLLEKANLVTGISVPLYHYLQRDSSITRTYNMDNLVGYWYSVYEQYEYLIDRVSERGKTNLLRQCALAAARTWAHYYDCCREERIQNKAVLSEMNQYMIKNIKMFGEDNWSFNLRIGVVFPHFINVLSFRAAWLINRARLGFEPFGV